MKKKIIREKSILQKVKRFGFLIYANLSWVITFFSYVLSSTYKLGLVTQDAHCYIAVMKKETTLLGYNNSILTLYSRKGSNLLRCERYRQRQTETAGDEDKLPYWPTRSWFPWLIESLPATSWDWLKTNCILRRHLHISFHYTHTFLFRHMTASAYLHRCVNGLYATKSSV